MTKLGAVVARRGRALLVSALVISVIAAVAFVAASRRSGASLPTAEVKRGEFVDFVELRGEIRPVRSVVLTAPMQAGDLQIVRLAKNGSAVKPGDIVVEFDGTTLRRTQQEKLSELRQAEAEIDQARAQARLIEEQNRTALMKARFDVDRAALDVIDRDFVARLDYERAKLALDDARQRLRQIEEENRADETANAADLAARQRKREKVQQDLTRAERSLAALQLRAPSAGVVSIMTNFRASAPFGAEQEFREGDRAWAGAGIVELPDVSAVHLTARLEEADRGRVAVGQTALVRVDAVPDREYHAKVGDISLLARIDFSSGWPPPRDFDLKLVIEDADAKLRPGMSAAVRIAVGRLTDVLVVPTEAVSLVDGRPTVYRLAGSAFEPQPVDVVRRGREQVAVASGVEAGDRLALQKPPAEAIRGRR